MSRRPGLLPHSVPVRACAAVLVLFAIAGAAALLGSPEPAIGATAATDECCAVPAAGLAQAGGSQSPATGVAWLFDTSGFPRRWNCGTWSSFLGWLHILSDAAIWGAYMAIPVIIWYFIRKRKTPLPHVAWLFIAFIASCGFGHLMESIIFWHPIYRLAGVWKAITATASWATVAALVPVVPKVLAWPTLAETNAKLEAEVARRTDVEDQLREVNLQLAKLNHELMFREEALNNHAIVAITDNRGRITYVNDLFCEISGYSREELIGQDHRIINSRYHPKEFFSDMYRTIAGGKIWHGDIRNRAKNGRYYWVKTTIIPDVDMNGKVTRYVAVRDDISHLKDVEDENSRQLAELRAKTAELDRKNAELEQFVYTASHDLKSPLVTILGFSSHMIEDVDRGCYTEVAEDARRIQRAASKMRAEVDDLLELSRVGRIEARDDDIDLAEVMREVIESCDMEVHEDLTTEVSTDFEVPVIRADRKRVGQILQNLLINALHHARAPERPLRIIIGSCQVVAGEVRLFVRDNGPGIQAEHQERIFGLFQRLNIGAEGTGMGLAIVRRIAESHGGRAWVESVPGEGSTFWVSFAQAARIPSSTLQKASV